MAALSRPRVDCSATLNHHGRGVRDADDNLGEPDGRIGEVSPSIGAAPERPVVALDDEPRVLRVGFMPAAVTFRTTL